MPYTFYLFPCMAQGARGRPVQTQRSLIPLTLNLLPFTFTLYLYLIISSSYLLHLYLLPFTGYLLPYTLYILPYLPYIFYLLPFMAQRAWGRPVQTQLFAWFCLRHPTITCACLLLGRPKGYVISFFEQNMVITKNWPWASLGGPGHHKHIKDMETI